jgi:hypothetical protein
LFNDENGLIAQIDNIAKQMADLDIITIPLSVLAKEWTGNPEKYGLRLVDDKDVDVRVLTGTKDKPDYPFPSYYDTLVTHNVLADDVFYYDDNHLTEKMYRNNADVYTYLIESRWLKLGQC